LGLVIEKEENVWLLLLLLLLLRTCDNILK
jgi:hypothetical protein